ncbi:uncharacterized protein LOC120844825, partial [Ixodes scapularis]|uniref:uncharacterized protein LOC120844825 n=1 Tax=Ixodes scapularis TaxID=6945 RepID=UPI001A9D0B93
MPNANHDNAEQNTDQNSNLSPNIQAIISKIPPTTDNDPILMDAQDCPDGQIPNPDAALDDGGEWYPACAPRKRRYKETSSQDSEKDAPRTESLTVIFVPTKEGDRISSLSSLNLSDGLDFLCPECIDQIRPNVRVTVEGVIKNVDVVHPETKIAGRLRSDTEIARVFEFSSTRWAANYRVMQIAREELSQEILVMQRSVPCLMTATFGTNFATHPSYVFLNKPAHLLLESSWKLILSNATAKKRANQNPALVPSINLSDTTLSAQAEAVLSRGPKFAPAYELSRIDQLATVHQVASKIPELERQDFLATGLRVACRYGRAPPSKLEFLEVVDELRRSELKLLESDRMGVFVVMTAGDF